MTDRALPPSPEDGELTPQEKRLVACAARGEWWTPLRLELENHLDHDPAYSFGWHESRNIRASVIACLLTGQLWPGTEKPWSVGGEGSVMLDRARIVGPLDLSQATLKYAFGARGCAFSDRIVMDRARATLVGLERCFLSKGMSAFSACFEIALRFTSNLISIGEITLADAIIGELHCSGATLQNPGACALNADRAEIQGSAFLMPGFSARGEVSFSGARIAGHLAMEAARLDGCGRNAFSAPSIRVGRDLQLSRIMASGRVYFIHAEVGGMFYCSAGQLDGNGGIALYGGGMRVTKNVHLENCLTIGRIIFSHARIGGDFVCAGGKVECTGGTVFDLNHISVSGDVYLNGLSSRGGSIDLGEGQVGGTLSAIGADLINPEGAALTAQGLSVASDVFLADNIMTSGEVDLSGARIGRSLYCTGGTFDNAGRTSLRARSVSIGGDAWLSKGFVARGEVILQNAEIGGTLDCSSGRFESAGSVALDATNAVVNKGIYLTDKFSAFGETSLALAQARGGLYCSGGVFENPGGLALNLNCITANIGVALRDGFSSIGEVNLCEARIAGPLDCSRAKFRNSSKPALNADGIRVDSSVFFDSLTAEGQVTLERAIVKGSLICRDASFGAPPGPGLNIALAKIDASLTLTGLKVRQDVPDCVLSIDLSEARCETYCDDSRLWSAQSEIVLDGFTFERFHNSATDWQTRLAWLKRQPRVHLDVAFRPQPWTQVVKVLRSMGHDADAREIAVHREIARSTSAATRWHLKLWLWLLRVTVGYGYRPHYALYWSLGILTVGWLTFASAANLGFMVPSDATIQASLSATHGAPLPPGYTQFNAPVYALDTFLPIIELGQEKAWETSDISLGQRRPTHGGALGQSIRLALGRDWSIGGSANGSPARAGGQSRLAKPTPAGFWSTSAAGAFVLFRLGVHRLVYWAMVLLGWALVSLYVAGMSGIMKRE